MIYDIEEGDCLHDKADYEYTLDPQPSLYSPRAYPTGYVVHCSKCGNLLYRYDELTGEGDMIDWLYKQLYTNRGRLEYLAKLMNEKGLEVPTIWKL